MLSGKRYLVLCDSTIWAELRTAQDEEGGGDDASARGKEKDTGSAFDEGENCWIVNACSVSWEQKPIKCKKKDDPKETVSTAHDAS